MRLDAERQERQRFRERLAARDFFQRLVLQPRQGLRLVQFLDFLGFAFQQLVQDDKKHHARERHKRPALVSFQLGHAFLVMNQFHQQPVGK